MTVAAGGARHVAIRLLGRVRGRARDGGDGHRHGERTPSSGEVSQRCGKYDTHARTPLRFHRVAQPSLRVHRSLRNGPCRDEQLSRPRLKGAETLDIFERDRADDGSVGHYLRELQISGRVLHRSGVAGMRK